MRVLYVSHFGGLGGAERSLLELLCAVRNVGVEPMLLCPGGPLMNEAAAAGIHVRPWCSRTITRSVDSTGWRCSLPRMLGGWWKLDRAVRRFRPHILHVNSAQAMLWNGPIGRLRGCPVVWHWRDFYDFRRTAKVMASGADAVVVISEAMMAFAADCLGPGARPIMLVRNGIADLPPHDDAEAVAVRRRMGIPIGAPLVTMAGQSVPRKGHAILLNALARMIAVRPNLHAWLLCSEHDRKASVHTLRLREQAAALGCGRSIQITDGVKHIASVLRAADVVAVPSLREPFGRIAVEAMLAERPVVASAVDGLNEIVAEGETGLLVPPGEPAPLASALDRVLNDPDAWRLRGRAARQRALRLFSVGRVASEVVSIYETLARP